MKSRSARSQTVSSPRAPVSSPAACRAISGVARVYFGSGDDLPLPGVYGGDGTDRIGIFRKNTGLWALRGVSRVYFGSTDDLPLAR